MPGPERVGRVRRHRDRLDAGRQHEVHDRHIVRRQVPQHVDVRLHQPEVDPDRVDETQLAELALADGLPHPGRRRGVAVGVVAHQRQAGGRGLRDHLLRLVGTGGQRLLHEHVLAGVERGADQLEVRRRGGRDRYCRDGRVVEYLVEARSRPDRRMPPEYLDGTIDVSITQPLQIQRLRGECRPDQIRSPVTRAHDRQADRRPRHPLSDFRPPLFNHG